MKHFSLLASMLMVSALLGSNTVALADDPPPVQPMYDGQFKCTDGYDPDCDPKLHPDGQDPKVRMLVNAQAQADHEKGLVDAPPPKTPASNSASGSPAGTSASAAPDLKGLDCKNPEGKKDDKKNGDKKDGKTADKKGDDKKSGAIAKDGDKKDAVAKDSADSKLQAKESYNPLKDALFAIQCQKYQNSIDLLKPMVEKDDKNAQAHYLLAISYVGLRRYHDATEQYNIVRKLAGNTKLSQLATDGLQRITASP